MLREPSVANQFYPGNPETLREMVSGFLRVRDERIKAHAVISPHAGYIYSGSVAGMVFSRVHISDDIILLGPNHTGMGERVAVYPSGLWNMPFGKVAINERLSRLVRERIPVARDDTLAHLMEHSLEVQLPFLQYLNPSIRIVPVTFMPIDLRRALEIGDGLAELVKEYDEDVLIVISSDMNHYEPHSITKEKDMEAINKILALDPQGLWDVVRTRDISMCGAIPAVVGIQACKGLGAGGAELIAHATSGEVSGDFEHVVGYAGIVIH